MILMYGYMILIKKHTRYKGNIVLDILTDFPVTGRHVYINSAVESDTE